jgi:hypothetical protein
MNKQTQLQLRRSGTTILLIGGVTLIGADLSIRITSVPTANSGSAARHAVRSRDARACVCDC